MSDPAENRLHPVMLRRVEIMILLSEMVREQQAASKRGDSAMAARIEIRYRALYGAAQSAG